MRNRVIHFFGDVSMTNGHEGLAEIASGKVAIDDLKPGEFVCFVNKSFSAMKLLTGCGVMIHWKQDSHKALFPEVITTLPHFLSGEDIGFSREVIAAITKYYQGYIHGKGGAKLRRKAKLTNLKVAS